MACNDITPCSQSSPCQENYDNCGCLNPTTFDCVTYTGTGLPGTNIGNNEKGDSALSKIDGKIVELEDAKGKVVVDGGDDTLGYLIDKLAPGLNISITQIGSGANKQIQIDSTTGGVPVDVNVQVSANDTSSDYLASKIATATYLSKVIINPGGNEQLKLDVVPSTLISSDSGNQLTLGGDGKLATMYTAPDGSETKVVQGAGVNISGLGTADDPYVISTNPSIEAARLCFDNTWRNVTLVATGNANVVYVAGNPQYRYRFDGSIEFKGSVTYTVSYGAYSSSNRKYTITIANIPTTCVTLTEQAGSADLKSINYIDVPQASADQITQLYGYIIRKTSQNIIVEFQSSFTNATSKTVVVSFDGVISHPTF